MEKLAAKLMPFFKDYGEEMKAYASALGITEGDSAMIRLLGLQLALPSFAV